MQAAIRERRVEIPGGEIVLRVPEAQARTLTSSRVYRHVVRPALRRLRRALPGKTAAPAATTAIPRRTTRVFFPRPVQIPEDTPEQRALAAQVKQHRWYHTIEFGHGIRTPGAYDHVEALPFLPLPAQLSGKRCLDVATFDGFWAFEMERRGAREVVALDIESWEDLDLPAYYKSTLLERVGTALETGTGFHIAAQVLNSKVDRRICNVYNLGPESFGEYDLVFCSDLLLHLTNPLQVMQNIYSVTRDEAIFIEPYIPGSEDQGPAAVLQADLSNCVWWAFTHDFLPEAARTAGFAHVEVSSGVDLRMRGAEEIPTPRVMVRAFRNAPAASQG